MKKVLILLVALLLSFGMSFNQAVVNAAEEFEIAMITDAGTIDDESFNQGTWEGIVEFATENSLTYKYYQPTAVSDDAYLAAIQLAVQGGAKVVVTPGFLFETSVHAAQTLHPTVKFVLIDGTPHAGDWVPDIKTNTVSIMFNEHESGFLAGYAAVQEGYRKLGFIGGMAVPAVVKFGIGFVAGAFYAGEELDVKVEIPNNRYTYLGEFAPSDNHKNLASSWYVTGTEIIFAAAGGAGSSVMSAANDNSKKMIGVDIDQAGQSPTVLTSALKQLGVAVQQVLQTYLDDTFVGGQVIYKGAENDGVGLPTVSSSWRFQNFTTAQYNTIYGKLKDGTINVPANYDELETFLDGVNGYPDRWAIEGTPAPTNNTGTIIAIVVGAAAVIGGAVFFFLKKK